MSRAPKIALAVTAVVAAIVLAILVVTPGQELTEGVIGAGEEPRGEPVPEQSFEMFDGSTASMADYEGRPVVVNFWASWCPPCVAEMPDLETVHQEFKDEVDFLGINTQDTPEAAADLVEQTGVTYDLARDPDGELFQGFGVFGMPSTFFVSPDGEIIARHTGILTLDQIREFFEDGLAQVEAQS
jgi:cytochrome c biogenesis protein CcmG, thiol:disulfide interchange protein DsbE